MGEYAEERIRRAIGEMEDYLTPRQRKKRELIRQAGIKETRQIMAQINHRQHCLDLLEDLSDEEEYSYQLGEDDAD